LFLYGLAIAVGAAPRNVLGQSSHVAVIYVDPNAFNSNFPGVSEIARQQARSDFYASHRDAYDFVVVFPAFAVHRCGSNSGTETEGCHYRISNKVAGIGIPVDPGEYSERLKGYIEEYALAPGDGQDLESALAVVAHEVAHQWSGAARFLDRRTGQTSDALLGLQGLHWSYFLDSSASVLYGAKWKPTSAGTYTATETTKRYSSLDLYLMGLLAPEELDPITLLLPSASVTTPAASMPPAVGTQIPATPLVVTATDLVAAMGPRTPASDQAQASFRAAFVVAAPYGQDPTQDQLNFVDAVRAEWANRFFFMTRGRAVMQTELVEHVPTSVASNPSVQLGVNYLLSHQLGDGGWADDPGTRARDTQAAIEALALFDSRVDVPPAVARGADFMGGLNPSDVDSSARRALALVAAGTSFQAGTDAPFGLQHANADGGWGLSPGYASTIIDTTLAGLAGTSPGEAASYLVSVQNTDGGWGLLPGGQSDISTTALVLHLMSKVDDQERNVAAASLGLSFIQLHRSPDSRYLEEDDRQDHTAEALLALAEWNALMPNDVGTSVSALLSEQLGDGCWEDSVARTAVALRALRALMLPNLAVRQSEIALSSSSVAEGEPTSATVLVRNLGYADAQNVAVRAFDASGLPFGPVTVIPLVPAGASAVASIALETTGHAGATQAFIVVDPAGAIDETTKEDNRAAVAFRVVPRPTLPDLFVAVGSLIVSPGSINRVPTPVSVTAQIGNSGLTDVANVTVALLAGSTVIATRSLSVPAGSSQAISLIGTLPSAGIGGLTVVLDPANLVQEARKDNNSASVNLDIQPSVDLSVAITSIAPNPVDLGTDVSIQFSVSNGGTSMATAATSLIEILDGAGAVLASMRGPTLSLASGATATGSGVWRASGSTAVAAQVTVNQPGDLNPADNVATALFTARESGKPNLAFNGGPVIVPSPPLEGKPAQVTVTVQNAGQVAAGATSVDLWLGDPASGGRRMARAAVPTLDGGAATTLTVPIAAMPGAPTALVARVDPDGLVDEYDETDNDAVLYVEPVRLPDLALQDGSIRPSSLFPRIGDQVSVTVVTDNLGDQPSASAVLELFAGAPEFGGVQLGSVSLPGINAHGFVQSAFQWDTTGWVGSVQLVAVVNRDGSAEESRKDNDRSTRTVVVQSGKLAVSNPYFSPNGDGVRDTTEIFYRLETPAAVDAAVRDERGRTVRTLNGASGSDGSGSLSWDGRTDAGPLAYDGAYVVHVQAQGQLAPLGEISVVLDTNRSSVLEAPRELRTSVVLDGFFQSRLPPGEPNLWLDLFGTLDEKDAIAFYAHTNASGTRECGYYRVPLDGGAPEQASPLGFECSTRVAHALSPDATTIYSVERGAGNYVITGYDLASGGVRELGTIDYYWNEWLGPDGKTWTLAGNSDLSVVTVDLDTGAKSTGPYPQHNPTWAPGGGSDAYLFLAERGYELHVASADGTSDQAVVVEYPFRNCIEYVGEECVKWEQGPIATPPGAYVLPKGASLYLGTFAWVTPTELAFSAFTEEAPGLSYTNLWLVDVTTGDVTQLAAVDELAGTIDTILADPAGRNLAIGGGGYTGGDQIWSVNLASGRAEQAAGRVANGSLSMTRLGVAIIDQNHGDWGTFVAHASAVGSLGNLGLNITGIRKAGSAEVVFWGTAADLNLDRWEISARPRGGSGTAIPVASGTNVVVDGELARWTPPARGTWEVTLTGTDLAGNTDAVSTVSSFPEVPVIANLRAEPKYFSPNGDGRQDEVVISYSVQEPLSTSLDISTSSGTVVRRIPVAHASAGSYSVNWDGRGDSGVVLGEGTYSITAKGSRADVMLDVTLPASTLSVGQLSTASVLYDVHDPGYRDCNYPPPLPSQERRFQTPPMTPPSTVPILAVPITVSANDDNLTRWELQGSDAESAAPGGFSPVLVGSDILAPARTIGLAPSQLPGNILRLQSWDAAGNMSVTPTAAVPEGVIVTAYGAAAYGDPCSGGDMPMVFPTTEHPAGPFIPAVTPGTPLQGVDGLPRVDSMILASERPFCYRPGYHAFVFVNSIREPLLGAAIAYKFGAEWVVDQAHSRLMPRGAVLWDARDAPDEVGEIEVRITDVQGREFAAPVRRGLCPTPVHGADAAVDCKSAAGLGSVRVSGNVRGPPHALEGVFGLQDSETGAILPMRPVSSTTAADGTVTFEYDAQFATTSLPGCDYDLVSTSGEPNSEVFVLNHFSVCGVVLTHEEMVGDVALVAVSSRYRKPVSRVDIYAVGQSVPRTLVASIPGASAVAVPVEVDLTPFPVGVPLDLSAHTVFVDGTTREEFSVQNEGLCTDASLVRHGVQVQVSVAPRTVALCSARAADRVIGATASSHDNEIVDLRVEVTSSSQGTVTLTTDPFVPGLSIGTTTSLPSSAVAPDTWWARARATDSAGSVAFSAATSFSTVTTPPTALNISAPAPGQRVCPVRRLSAAGTSQRALRVEGVVAGAQLQTPRMFLGCGGEPLNQVAYASVSDAVGEIDLTSRPSSDCQVMVEVRDEAGASYCTSPVPFHLIGNSTLGISAAPVLFSPNGDGRLDVSTLSFSMAEPSTVTVTGTDSKPRAGNALVAEIGAGTQSVPWNGTLDGIPAADGDVSLRALATDPCGNVSEAQAVVRVDTTPPLIRLDGPKQGERISGLVNVTGEVSDANFLDYDLAIGAGSSPTVFSTVGTFDRPAKGTIGDIPTASLDPGTYTVRIQARDRAGNRSTATVTFDLTPNQIIRSLVVDPALVSPNHDGLLDSSIARYEILAPATVSLDLINPTSGSVQHVLSPVSMPASSGEVDLPELRLAGLPDGAVTVRLTATVGALEETEDVLLTLDRVPPGLAIDDPANGAAVAHVAGVRGHVEEDHLDSWTLTLLQGATSTQLGVGRAPLTGVLATLTDLPEGDYALFLDARDGAGNHASQRSTFSVDRTPPVVALDAPAPASWVSGLKGPFDVTGQAVDPHLADVRLDALVEGEGPRELFHGSSVASGGHVTSWDVAGEADGPVELRLVATDSAGNTSERRASVTVDNTPPVAKITAPRDIFLHHGDSITGVATDDYLAGWKLELTTGLPSTTSIWVPLAQESNPVLDGVLTALAGLPRDGTYGLRLTVSDEAGNTSEDVSWFRVDTTPPQPPPSLVAQLHGADVALSWDASPDADVVGYQVLRASSTGSFTPLGALVSGTSTTDPHIADGHYRYVVVAVDAAGLQSGYSPEAKLDVDLTPPRVAINAPSAGAAVSGTFSVSGTAYSNQDFKEYRLSVGVGTSPASYQLVRRSAQSVVSAELGKIDVASYTSGVQLTIRLEGEDLSGNVAEARTTVTVDDAAPSAPVLLSATATGNAVYLEWQPSPEPDVLGYIVFRNGSVASAPGGSAGSSITASLLPPGTTSYVDAALPDGVYTYEVQAYDRALNASGLSNSLSAEIETEAPRATIASPEPLARLDGTVAVVAEVKDLDAASVLIQVRDGGAGAFVALGDPMTERPYTVPLDLSTYDSPVIELRAIATDTRGNTDPAPSSTFVFHAPIPAAPNVSATVNGAGARVAWSDLNPAGSIAGYEVTRDGASLLPAAFRPTATATASVSDTTAYLARDGMSWTAWTASPAENPWWRLELAAPVLVGDIDVGLFMPADIEIAVRVNDTWVPVHTGSDSGNVHVSLGGGLEIGAVRVSFLGGQTDVGLYEVTLNPLPLAPGPSWQDSNLAIGSYSYQVDAVSALGVRSSGTASARVYAPTLDPAAEFVSTSPLHVTGSGATAGARVTLFRGVSSVASSLAGADGTFSMDVPLANGTNTLTARATDAAGNVSLPSDPISVEYDGAPTAALTLRVTGVRDSTVSLAFDVTGDRSRIAGFHVRRAGAGATASTVADLGAAVRSVSDPGLPNGTYTYTVVAYNAHLVEGGQSNAVNATVAIAPPSLVSGLTVSQVQGFPALRLRWTLGAAGDEYLVERALSEAGPFSAINPSAPVDGDTYLDAGLVPGVTYFYRVREVDAVGNIGPPSTVAWGVPLAGSLASPSIFAPTSPGWPITVSTAMTDVSGVADPYVLVELRSNDIWVGESRAGGPELHSELIGSVSGSAGFGVAPDGLSIATGWSSYGVEELDVTGPEISLSIADPALQSFGRAAFSAGGGWLAFEARATDDGRMHVWVSSTYDGSFRRVSTESGAEGAPVWSPDGKKLAYEASRDGSSTATIGVLDLGAWTEQTLSPPPGVDLQSPAWTVSGDPLAIASATGSSGSRIVRFDGSAWQDVYSSAHGVTELVVSPDGAHAALLSDVPGAPLVVLDLAAGEVSNTDSTPASSRHAAFTMDGRSLIQVRDGMVLRTLLAMDETEPLGSTGPVDALAGTAQGLVALLATGEVMHYEYGGVFNIQAVPLFVGDNVLVASALDGAGSRGPPSKPISVTLEESELADLAVTNVAIQPSFPVPGDAVNAVVTIQNLGGVTALASSLLVKEVLPDGSQRELTPVSIGPVRSGGTATAIVALGTVDVLGPHQVIAIADAAGVVPDPDRQNNLVRRTFTVVASRAIQLAVAAEPASAPVNGQFTARVTVQNPAAPVDATVITRLADPSGAAVFETPPVVYHPLAGGATTTLQAVLPVGTTMAGDYQVVAVLTVAGAAPLIAATPVAVQPERNVTLEIAAGRFSYAPTSDVDLASVVTNGSRNAVLSGASYQLEVLDVAGHAAWTTTGLSLPDIWMGGTSSASNAVPAATLGPGDFVAHAWVAAQGATLAEAYTEFTVLASPTLTGSLSVAGQGDPPAVPAGTATAVTATFQNAGTVASQATTGRLLLVAPGTGEVLSTVSLTAPALAPGASAIQTMTIPTTGLALGTYSLALVVEEDSGPTTIATVHFRVADAAPPTLALVSPAQGVVVPGVVHPLIRAHDSDSGVMLVRASAGGALSSLTRIDGNALDGTWTGAVILGPDGSYTLILSAVDGDGNDGLTSPTSSNPITLSVVSDRTPPLLQVDGVADGALVNTAVVLSVTATDLHLAAVSADIDGLAYQPGTPYAVEGAHVFTARAIDLAGNATTDALMFSLDMTPPDVTIAGVTDGQYLDAPVTPVILITDQNPVTYSAVLDGNPWTGGPIATEGRHVLAVDARDLAGNTRHVETGFWIDLTPPSVSITGVDNGACYARAVTPVVNATDANLGAVSATLDRQPFTSGATVAQEGTHAVAAVALDNAGHQTSAQVLFSIDTTSPTITMPNVDGQFFVQPVTLVFSVTDTTAPITGAALDGVPFTSGGLVSAEGRHVLTVQAHDCAGNQSSRTVAFVIDRTAPTLVLSGATDQSTVSGPVVITADASDANLVSVALELDGAPYVAGTPISAHGLHLVSGVATDAAGNSTHASLAFTIDNTAPRIFVDGVADGDVLGHSVTPIVTVTDSDLAGWDASVDGVPLPTGGAVNSEGIHNLAVVAHDLAGNQSTLSISFTIDLTPPAIDIAGVASGVCYAHDVVPTYSAQDANLTSASGTLDGVTFASGSTVGAEGDHNLIVSARDGADHAVSKTTPFVVDKTAPSISLASLDGKYFAAPVIPSYTVSDAHLTSTTVTLDGAPLAPGAIVSAEGSHTLVVTAQDCAGNADTRTATFTIDVTPPTLSLTGVADSAIVNGPVSVTATVSDRTPTTLTMTRDGAVYVSGTAITTEGLHTVAAVATDAAGYVTRASKTFTIDSTPPQIQIAGVTDGELTNRDVIPVITVTDPNLGSWTVTIDGLELLPASSITTEGKHALLVVAQDRAGNEARATRSFEIDKTPPSVSASVAEGTTYPGPVVVTYSANDAHLDTSTATLDGLPFASGGTIDGAGSHTLRLTARDTAGNVATATIHFTVAGQEPTYTVKKHLVLDDTRVLVRVACGKQGDASAAFLARALPRAHLTVVRNDVDLLVGLRSGLYDLIVVTDQVGMAGQDANAAPKGLFVPTSAVVVQCPGKDPCAPKGPVPPLTSSELTKRLQAELTEAVYRGFGLVVFRTLTPQEPWLRDALGLQFLGHESSTTVNIAESAVSGPLQLTVLEGVALKLDGAKSIGTFKRDGKVAAAVHGYGLGEVVVLGFDPATATGAAETLVSGAVAFASTEKDPAAAGVVAVRIDVQDDGPAATTRVREHLDPGLLVESIRNGGVLLPDGDIEWTLDQDAGELDSLEYLLRLPATAGTYQTTAEVARMVAGQAEAAGTYPLSITLSAGAPELQSQAEQLAAALPTQGSNKSHRQKILNDLAKVKSQRWQYPQEREAAIGYLLDAVDQLGALQGVEVTQLRLAIDSLLALWEERR
jgi:subtilase family serine protease/flagellar hook assembly protein FlgD